ncbi:MAG: class I SAM-dependent methyltransferase [Actinomycetota bacterium]
MPDSNPSLHTDMLKESKKAAGLPRRLYRAIKKELAGPPIYGMEWGDPDQVLPLKFVRDKYVLPYILGDSTIVEIGPGGGRWTRYLLACRRLYAVDTHQELLDELSASVRSDNVVLIKNNGANFPGVPAGSVDFVFSFGCFVHLDAPVIEEYLKNLRPILKPGANVVIQYSDKTKIMARENDGFSENDPERMRTMVSQAGYTILEEDLTTLWHSSIIRFAL